MSKYRLIFSTVVLTYLVLFGILIWRTSTLFTDLAALLSTMDSGLDLSSKTRNIEETINLHLAPQNTGNSTAERNIGYYESIEETIARIQRDVIVTGTIIGTPEEETAIVQIENLPDRSFTINTQLMDGFIITEINENQITLKNQLGDETFSMKVQPGKR